MSIPLWVLGPSLLVRAKRAVKNFVTAAMGPKQTLAAFYECTVHQSGHLTFSGVRVA